MATQDGCLVYSTWKAARKSIAGMCGPATRYGNDRSARYGNDRFGRSIINLLDEFVVVVFGALDAMRSSEATVSPCLN